MAIAQDSLRDRAEEVLPPADKRAPPAPAEARAPDAADVIHQTAVMWIQIQVDEPRDAEEAQLLSYLRSFFGRPATDDVTAEAERALEALGRYRSARCSLWDRPEFTGRMLCELSRARTIRKIHVDGLPLGLLEADFRRRISLRPGEAFDLRDHEAHERIARQRRRLQVFLERQGLYGARVDVETRRVEEGRAEVDVFLRVRGGAFPRVRGVEVVDAGPLDEDAVRRALSWMCLSTDGWLDALETAQVACVTQARLKATAERLEADAVGRGHPQARLSVDVVPVSPEEPGSCGRSERERASLAAEGLPIAPRCVDLVARLAGGPKLDAAVVLEEGIDAEDDTWRLPSWAVGAYELVDIIQRARLTVRRFLVEPIGRAVQFYARDRIEDAADTRVYVTDLDDALTFSQNRSLDLTEAERAKAALEDVLAAHGRFDARVDLAYDDRGDEVVVRYRVAPGPVSAVTLVRFIGNETFSSARLIEGAELSARPRTPLHGGFVSRRALEHDVERLRAFYEARGFREVDVGFEVLREPGGGMEVLFRVDEGERFVLAELKLVGGDPALTSDVVRTIAHCKAGVAAEAGELPEAPDDCRGNPFLPDEFEADEQRVLNLYVARGYPYTRVRLEPGFTPEGPTLAIHVEPLVGDELTTVRLGEVFIDGALRTRRGVLLREMALDDEVLRPVEVAEAVTRLRRTGLFSRVDLDYLGVEERRDRVDLRLRLEEKPSASWDVSAAFSTNRLFSVRNELRHRNLLGSMFDLDVIADIGLFIGRASLLQAEVKWPRILGFPVSLKLVPQISYEDQPSFTVPRAPVKPGPTPARASWFAGDLRRRTMKVASTLSLEWRPTGLKTVVGLDHELRLDWDDPEGEKIDAFSLRALATADGLLPVLQRRPLNISAVTPRVSYINVDNPFDPTAGGLLEASLRAGSPFIGNQEWLGLVRLRGAYYLTLFDRFTIATHARTWTGVSSPPDDRRSSLLDQDLVAIGGDRTVRGYGQDSVGVLHLLDDAVDGKNPTQHGVLAVAGVVANLELRTTLVRNLVLGDLKLATFVDGGVVTHNDPLLRTLDTDRLVSVLLLPDDPTLQPRAALSVGVGLRYVLPVGPASFDCAVSPLPIDDAYSNVRTACHLQLGYAF